MMNNKKKTWIREREMRKEKEKKKGKSERKKERNLMENSSKSDPLSHHESRVGDPTLISPFLPSSGIHHLLVLTCSLLHPLLFASFPRDHASSPPPPPPSSHQVEPEAKLYAKTQNVPRFIPDSFLRYVVDFWLGRTLIYPSRGSFVTPRTFIHDIIMKIKIHFPKINTAKALDP